MKSLLILLTSILSVSSFAAISTKLDVPVEPSVKKIKMAITALQKASKSIETSNNLKSARKLIAVTPKSIQFNAAIYINGNKQFNGLGDEVMSWNFSGYCYKGNSLQAVSLINKALELGFWESDEEWIEKAVLSGESKIQLLLMDGPNDYEWTVKFDRCAK